MSSKTTIHVRVLLDFGPRAPSRTQSSKEQINIIILSSKNSIVKGRCQLPTLSLYHRGSIYTCWGHSACRVEGVEILLPPSCVPIACRGVHMGWVLPGPVQNPDNRISGYGFQPGLNPDRYPHHQNPDLCGLGTIFTPGYWFYQGLNPVPGLYKN